MHTYRLSLMGLSYPDIHRIVNSPRPGVSPQTYSEKLKMESVGCVTQHRVLQWRLSWQGLTRGTLRRQGISQSRSPFAPDTSPLLLWCWSKSVHRIFRGPLFMWCLACAGFAPVPTSLTVHRQCLSSVLADSVWTAAWLTKPWLTHFPK